MKEKILELSKLLKDYTNEQCYKTIEEITNKNTDIKVKNRNIGYVIHILMQTHNKIIEAEQEIYKTIENIENIERGEEKEND